MKHLCKMKISRMTDESLTKRNNTFERFEAKIENPVKNWNDDGLFSLVSKS